eukprot:260521_1
MLVMQHMKQQHDNAVTQRELLLNQLDLKYASYINLLLQRKALIASSIVKKYDKMIHNIKDRMYNYLNTQIQAHMPYQNSNTANTTSQTNVSHNKQANSRPNTNNAFADDQQHMSNNHSKSERIIPIMSKHQFIHSKSTMFSDRLTFQNLKLPQTIINIPTIQNKHTIQNNSPINQLIQYYKSTNNQLTPVLNYVPIIPTKPTVIYVQQKPSIDHNENIVSVSKDIEHSSVKRRSERIASNLQLPQHNGYNERLPEILQQHNKKSVSTVPITVSKIPQQITTENVETSSKSINTKHDETTEAEATSTQEPPNKKRKIDTNSRNISEGVIITLKCDECNEIFYQHTGF